MAPVKWKDFIYCLINTLSINDKRRTDKENLLISFMGVGEPLLNLKLIEDVYKNEDFIELRDYRYIQMLYFHRKKIEKNIFGW